MALTNLDPLLVSPSGTLSDSNRLLTVATAVWHGARGYPRTDKRYFEVAVNSGSNGMAGVAASHCTLHNQSTDQRKPSVLYVNSGTMLNDGSSVAGYSAWTSGQRAMVAFDPVARKVWFGRNGVWVGDPGAGTGGIALSWTGPVFPHIVANASSVRIYTAPSDMAHTIPSGFSALDDVRTYSGTISDKVGAFAARSVALIRESDFSVMDVATSNSTTGAFSLVTPYNEPHSLAFFGESDRKALIYSGLSGT